MKKLIITGLMACAVYALSALPAMAQQKITGRVVDAQTQEPVAGANVTYAKDRGASTNANGNFSIPCSGTVHIAVSYIGYRTFEKTLQSCTSGLQISLQPSSYSLQKINVEGQVYIKEPTSVSTITQAELTKQSGLRLKDALNTVPGVEMQTRSPWGGQRITIRGYYPNAGKSANFNGLGYQLFINDVPVTSASGVTIMDDIDFATLGKVDIIKGPSPLYGNEIAGTVNLYSQRARKNGTAISEQIIGGSYGLFRNTTTLLSKTDKMDMRVNYGHQNYDSFRPHDASNKDYISINGHYKVSDRDMISAYFSYNHSKEDLAGGMTAADFYAHKAIANPDYVNNDGGVNIKSFRAGITSYHSFNRYFSNKTTVFATGHTLNQNFAHGFTFNNNLNVGARTDFMYQQQVGRVGINGQIGAFLQKSDESADGVFIPPFIHAPFPPSTSPQFPTDDQNYALNYNIFTQWAFSLPSDFEVTIGGILNFNEFGIRNMLHNGKLYNGSTTESKSFDPTFSPSISVLKSFNDKASVYASVTTGNTPPLLSNILASDGSVNDQLEPEKAVQYEIGTKGNLLEGAFTYQVALFDLEIRDRLATRHENSVEYTTNVGKQQNRGIEMAVGYTVFESMEAAVSQLRLWGSYTYSDFSYSDFKFTAQSSSGSDSTTANYSGNSVAGVAPNMLSLGADLQTKPGFYLHAKLKYMDKMPITFDNQTSLKSYTTLSARLGYQRELGNHFALDAFVGSDNLTGSTYYNFSFVGEDAADLGDGYISPAPYKATVYGGMTLSYRL